MSGGDSERANGGSPVPYCEMNRTEFHKLFKSTGPAVLPVIHVLNLEQTRRNILLAQQEGAQGLFLINHDFSYDRLLPIVQRVRNEFPFLWMGVNFLGVSGEEAFPVLGTLAKGGTHVDAYWADNACIDEHSDIDGQTQAKRIQAARDVSGWKGLYFGGTAFKMQRSVADKDVGRAASIAAHYMDVVTTSGRATGEAASIQKIAQMRAECSNVAMALASGVTPTNAASYLPFVDCFMVATGISPPGDFYNFDPLQLRALVHVSRSADISSDSWYLSLIAPNTKGTKFAWLDPTSIYTDARAFSELAQDLLAQFSPQEFDLVVGIDAMGFPLAAAMAIKAGKGFLVIRKAGRLCVDTDEVEYDSYSGSGHIMEMRKNAFPSGTRVLLVDQWIETGGTITGAIKLVERQGGVVVGIATICVETKPRTQELCRRYKVVHVVSPTLQPLFDKHTFLGAMLEK